MKILIDLTSLADNFSGIERYALNISKQMIIQDSKNNYILVFKNEVHQEFEKFKDRKNIEIRVINGKKRLIFNQIILPYKLYRAKADKYLFLAFPSPILFFRKGIINAIHDLTCWDYPETMKFLSKWYFRISILNAMKCSERILTVSNFSKNRIINKFGRRKDIEIIYNGVSEVFENFKINYKENDLCRLKYGIKEEYIMALGTLEPRKNLELLIKAFIELKRENNINSKLVLVGRKGWKFNSIVEGIDENIKKDIIFTGFIEDIHLPNIYFNADLFIFPSVYEGFGIPLIEAITIGTKVVMSDIEVFREILGDYEFQFESNNLLDLKRVILKAIRCRDNNEIYTLKEKIKCYKWEISAKKLIQLLKEGEVNEYTNR